MENLIFAISYTLVVAIVAYYYWLEGNKRGVREAIGIIMQYEPEALMRISPKLREMLDVTADIE
jgi:hypothetical protein